MNGCRVDDEVTAATGGCSGDRIASCSGTYWEMKSRVRCEMKPSKEFYGSRTKSGHYGEAYRVYEPGPDALR